MEQNSSSCSSSSNCSTYYLPWTRMCTEVVLGRLLVWTAHTYWPSSVMSTFSILMVNSSWLRVTRLTLGSTDHLSSPAYSILDRFSHAVWVTMSPCAHLKKNKKNNAESITKCYLTIALSTEIFKINKIVICHIRGIVNSLDVMFVKPTLTS